jgi:hypothetical protein
MKGMKRPAELGLPLCLFLLVASALLRTEAKSRSITAPAQTEASGVVVGPDNIGGVVTSSNGPEAGVWVIAETSDLSTKFRKIVVTDDRGRYLLPELPKANYKVFVRGYGLVDSTPVDATPGKTVALTATIAPTPQAAAEIYPPNYWMSMLKIPPKDAFPIPNPGVSSVLFGINNEIPTQAHWIDLIKSGCQPCHQMGDKITREMPKNLGTFPSTKAAWERRMVSGQLGEEKTNTMKQFGYDRGIAMFADWTDRIMAGEVPPAPPRPRGIERNVVLTLWDVGGPKSFFHGAVSTSKWNPQINHNGPAYEADWEGGTLVSVDPQENTASTIQIPLRNEADKKLMPTWSPQSITAPSPYWGDELVWKDDAVNPANTQMDSKGRLWVNLQNRKPDSPAFCKAANGNKYAQAWEAGNANNGNIQRIDVDLRQSAGRVVKPWENPPGWGVDIYDPKTGKITAVDLCFGQSHAAFSNDKDETIYFSLRRGGLGWFKTRIWDETHDAAKAQGWCAPIIDYNGDGKYGPQFTMLNEPADPKIDRIGTPDGYGVSVNPVDGSVWYAGPFPLPGRIVRAIPGPNPPSTCATEVYEPPFNNPEFPGEMHYAPHGIDVDTNGIVWTALAGSGDLARFDRSKCKVLNGPTATGQHCPEGWTIYPVPGPMFQGTDAHSDWHYLNWVDRYNTLGLGENVSVVLGTSSDSLRVFKPDTKEWFTFHVPYPMGFYSRDLDGRIDNPKTGWKGRGLWGATETRVIWHAEGGKGQVPQMVHFQLRPDPLAK